MISRRALIACPLPLAGCGGGSGTPTVQAIPVALARSELATLINATPSGGALTLAPGTLYQGPVIDVTGKRITIIQHGATIDGGYLKSDHGNKLTLLGGLMVGTSPAVSLVMQPSVNTSDDYRLEGVDFGVDAEFAVRLIGAREGRINACTFAGSGLYLRATVSPYVKQAIFAGQSKRTAVFYDGTGSPYDAGLVLRDCEVMGWDRGVDVRYTDWLVMSGTTVDYNRSCNTLLVSQDGATITDCYLGSQNTAPALQITAGPDATVPAYSDKITVRSHFTGHHEGPGYDCIVVDGSPDNIVIESHIDFYTRYGIRYALSNGRMTVANSTFAPRGGYGKFPIFNSGHEGDSGLRLLNNVYPTGTDFTGAGITFAKWAQ